MAIEIFNVEWTKLQSFDKALNQSASQEGGLYAMFKRSGSNYKLHYIGMSKDFFKRSGTHRNTASHLMSDTELKKCYISFGLVTAFETSRMTHDITPIQLRQAESFFINTIKPIGNDASTKKGYKGNPIIVFNKGMKGLFGKTMSNCPDLIKLLKSNLTTKPSSSGSSFW